MKEVFKNIYGYEGYYQVSNFGNVRSKDRIVIYSNGAKHNYIGRLRKPSKSTYRLIALSKGGKVSVKKISRLVALHFIKRNVGKNVVNHKDGNKYNDNVLNLEWCTYSENTIHSFDNNLSKKINKVSGVFFETRRNKWASYLYRNNKNIFIGRYNTEDEAINERKKAIENGYN